MKYNGLASYFEQDNPILPLGDIGFEVDTGKFKIGTGELPWNSLPYAGTDVVQETGTSTTSVMSQNAVTSALSTTLTGVLDVLLAGLSVLTSTPIEATDSIIVGFGKLQAQITSLTTTVSGKEPSITAGTSSQYWSGDKSWQTLDKTAVGLGNVTNTNTSTTTNITEGTKLFYTDARAIGAILTGWSVAVTRTAITAADSVSVALGKAQKYLNDLSTVAFSGSYADLGNRPYQLFKSNTPGSVTGTVSETKLISVFIPAGTFAANDHVTVTFCMNKPGTSNGFTPKAYLNNADSFAGATLLATYPTATAAQRFMIGSRTFTNRGSTSSQKIISTSLAVATDAGSMINTTTSSLAYDTSADLWVVVTCTPANTIDTITADWLTVEIKR